MEKSGREEGPIEESDCRLELKSFLVSLVAVANAVSSSSRTFFCVGSSDNETQSDRGPRNIVSGRPAWNSAPVKKQGVRKVWKTR